MLVFVNRAEGINVGDKTGYRPLHIINNVNDEDYPVPLPPGQMRIVVPEEMGAEAMGRLFLLDADGNYVRWVEAAKA